MTNSQGTEVIINGARTIAIITTIKHLIVGTLIFVSTLSTAVWAVSRLVSEATATATTQQFLSRMETDDFVRRTVPEVTKRYVKDCNDSLRQQVVTTGDWDEFRKEMLTRLDAIESKLN